mgnify:CR=1 FL=1
MPGVTPSIKGQQDDVRRVAEHALGHAVTDAQASDLLPIQFCIPEEKVRESMQELRRLYPGLNGSTPAHA